MNKREKWLRLREELYYERGGKWLKCEIDGCSKFPYELHHVFFHTSAKKVWIDGKKVALSNYFDTKFNLQWVCHEHHREIANGRTNELAFWKRQVSRYGNEQMEWYNSIPLNYKEKFW